MLKPIKPTLLLNEEKCRRNIRKMVSKAQENKLSLRPHLKTAQSLAVAEWFREEGIDKITVSSLQMAEYFADAGWKDITVAFPLNLHEIECINRLVAKTENLQLLIDEGTEIEGLKSRVNGQLNLYLKIDCGTHRTGFDPQDDSGIEEMLNVIKTTTNLNFKGFLTHAGHSYRCRSAEEVLEIHRHTKQLMLDLKAKYSSDFPDLQISIGDTPTCSIANDWTGVDEIRPGNFTFYDVMQYHIGSCSFDEIALTMLCPIVSKHKNRNELVIYGGAVHLSKDSIVTDGHVNFGYVRKYGESNVCLPQNYLN